jgi:hypothetical protein
LIWLPSFRQSSYSWLSRIAQRFHPIVRFDGFIWIIDQKVFAQRVIVLKIPEKFVLSNSVSQTDSFWTF